jgi:hypothetical protein
MRLPPQHLIYHGCDPRRLWYSEKTCTRHCVHGFLDWFETNLSGQVIIAPKFEVRSVQGYIQRGISCR